MPRRPFLAIAFILLSVSAARAWTDETRIRMASDVVRLAPPPLARILKRHAPAWRSGWDDGYPAAATGTSAGPEMARRVDAAIAAIHARAGSDTFSRLLGAACRLAADTSDPMGGASTAASTLRSDGSTVEFDIYAQGVIRRTPLVFSGWMDDAVLLADIPGFFDARARAASADAEALLRAFHPDGRAAAAPAASFDDRSIPYAIATLGHSRGVSDAANLLLAIWKSIGGDTTGTPWLGRMAAPERRY